MAENSPLIAFLEIDPQGAMETPPREANPDQPMQAARRATRSALAEIPLRLNMLTVQEIGEVPPLAQTQLATPQAVWPLNVNVNVPSSYMSPSPSPDEMVIQQRGRRRMPVTWSPDLDAAKQQHHQHTPVKSSPAKNNSNGSGIVLRSTPRKRLLLDASVKDPFTTPEKVRRLSPSKVSPNSKKAARVERLATPLEGPLDLALLALSPQQLVDIVQQLMVKHQFLEQDVKELLPVPDIRPLEDRLSELRKNIYKSLPNSRLTSKTDSPAFNRVATHLSVFKKCLLDQLRQLTSSQNWGAVLEYVLTAWTYVRATPLWDNPPHNNCRRACFKSLTASCLSALKRGGPWSLRQLEHIETKLESMAADSEDIQACIKHLAILKK
ncbi:Uncharacterized protein GBIM_17070 [Gryllus bimaculatus]|nr:Uncharacterized protein GBIM_17070 [Gryllus bimaculatus]